MIISVFGQTDKRAVIYTLMKMLQKLGDTCVISDNRHLLRLTEDGTRYGYFQNIAIFVTDTSADEVFSEIQHTPDDYDFIIMDNKYTEDADICFYVEGMGPEENDEDLLEILNHPNIIKIGPAKGAIPYTLKMFTTIEHIEYYRKLQLIEPKLTTLLINKMAPVLKLTPKVLAKVVSRK